jgi:hypothetical protein
VRRIVFEAAIGRRIVGRGDHDAVSQPAGSVAVIPKDRVRDHWSRRVAVLGVDHRGYAVRREDLKRGLEGRPRQRMGVDADKQGAIDAPRRPVKTDRLRDRQDMGFIKGVVEGRAAMARCSKRHPLRKHGRIGMAVIVGLQELAHIQQRGGRKRFARAWIHIPRHQPSRTTR